MCYRHDNSWMRRPWVRLVTLNNANISYFINRAGILKPANIFLLLQTSCCWRCGFASLTWALAVGSGPLCLSDRQNISPLAGLGGCSGSWPLGRAHGSCFIIDPCALLLSLGCGYLILFCLPLVCYPLVEMEAVHVCACVQNWASGFGLFLLGFVCMSKSSCLCFSLCTVRLLGSSLPGVGKRRALLRVQTKGFKRRKKKSVTVRSSETFVLPLGQLGVGAESTGCGGIEVEWEQPCLLALFLLMEFIASKKQHNWQSWRLCNPCNNYWLDVVCCELTPAACQCLCLPLGQSQRSPRVSQPVF